MPWWSAIFGALKPAKDIIQTFKESEEAKGRRGHLERMAGAELDMSVLRQFAAEFHERESRSWWDSLVDGLNRLPRPIMALGVLALFALAPLYPARFLEAAAVYEKMPAGFWALVSVIVGFYFGGRMQLKSQDMAVKGGQLAAARDLVAMRREFRELAEEDEPAIEDEYRRAVSKGRRPPDNKVVDLWKEKRAAAGGA